MAKQIEVEIDGNKVSNTLDVQYGLTCAKDTNGAPVDARPRLGSIVITRRSDRSTDWWSWSLRPFDENFKSGTITFYDPRKEATVLKTVEWQNGFVKSYTEDVPHVDKKRQAPQVETIEVSAEMITINGVEWRSGPTWL